MPIRVCTCLCSSVEQLARQTLQKYGYPDWLNIPIPEGKSASLSLLSSLPQFPEVEMLATYIHNASKWVVIIGWCPETNACRWTDIAHGGDKAQIEAQLIIETFS